MGHPRTTPQVLSALQSYQPGIDVNAQDLADETGLTIEQVRAAMRSLIASEKHNIEVVLRGRTWRYHGPAKTTKGKKSEPAEDRLFTLVGKLASGERIARGDSTGNIYVVTELELGN